MCRKRQDVFPKCQKLDPYLGLNPDLSPGAEIRTGQKTGGGGGGDRVGESSHVTTLPIPY